MYTIGEFSKIVHVSTRMLRYYESLNLIQPADIGSDNGYRYYDSSQLDTIFQIQKLQSYGIKLKDVPSVLSKNPEKKYQYYQRTYHALLQERKQLDMKIQLLCKEIGKMEGHTMENQKVILLPNPEQWVYGVKKKINLNAKEIQKLFQDLYSEISAKGIKRTGPAQLAYLNSEFTTENMEVEAQVEVMKNTPSAHLIPACTYASTIYRGPHEMLHEAYETLGHFMSSHPEYHLCGPVLERFITDDHEHGIFETGVLFPIVQTNPEQMNQ